MAVTIGSFAQVMASATASAGGMAAGATTDIATALGATESKYPLLEFRLDLTTTPSASDTGILLYRRRSDGTNSSPAPSAGYRHELVGEFVLDAATGSYFAGPVHNFDPADTYYWFNDDSVSHTGTLYARGKDFS